MQPLVSLLDTLDAALALKLPEVQHSFALRLPNPGNALVHGSQDRSVGTLLTSGDAAA